MPGSQSPLIAREGLPLLAANALLMVLAYRWFGPWAVLPLALGLAALIALFRDPHREVPVAPLAAVSPVDGTVIALEPTDRGVLEREAQRIVIRIDNFGAYSARSPIEGKVLDPRDNLAAGSRLLGVSGLWLRSDEDDDVVLLFRSPRLIGAPRSFVRYGERLGQGQRFGYLRLASHAELLLPIDARVKVKRGDKVRAGSTVLAKLRHA